ncbi:STAS domain-containing protein [Streptomyces sp. NPDC101733]|uniref:STAS domain-containing protein n=1 Tax=unclassified Streptomyces TaxID=2593676 RepID=UPI00380AA6E6
MTDNEGHTGRPPLAVTVQDTDHPGQVLSLTGDLDHAQTGPLEQALTEALNANQPLRLLVIDLTGVGFCDSSGLNTFLKARHETEEHSIELRLVHAGPRVRRLLQITGTAELFSLYDDLVQALT